MQHLVLNVIHIVQLTALLLQAKPCSAASGGSCSLRVSQRHCCAKLGPNQVEWPTVRAWGRLGAVLLLLSRRGAEKKLAVRESEMEAKRAERKASQTVRTAQNVLGQSRRAAESASKRIKAVALARRAAGLGSAMQDRFIAQLLDLTREAADIGRELAACSSDFSQAIGDGRKERRAARLTAATACAATRCEIRRRSRGSATSTRADDLRTRLCALLANKRSTRARVGRWPAVFRRPAFFSRHTALAREFFKPTAAPSSETTDRAAEAERMEEAEGAAAAAKGAGLEHAKCVLEAGRPLVVLERATGALLLIEGWGTMGGKEMVSLLAASVCQPTAQAKAREALKEVAGLVVEQLLAAAEAASAECEVAGSKDAVEAANLEGGALPQVSPLSSFTR